MKLYKHHVNSELKQKANHDESRKSQWMKKATMYRAAKMKCTLLGDQMFSAERKGHCVYFLNSS
jgi:hypothetical protein